MAVFAIFGVQEMDVKLLMLRPAEAHMFVVQVNGIEEWQDVVAPRRSVPVPVGLIGDAGREAVPLIKCGKRDPVTLRDVRVNPNVSIEPNASVLVAIILIPLLVVPLYTREALIISGDGLILGLVQRVRGRCMQLIFIGVTKGLGIIASMLAQQLTGDTGRIPSMLVETRRPILAGIFLGRFPQL